MNCYNCFFSCSKTNEHSYNKKIEIRLDEFKLNDLDKQVFETKKTVETINKVRMLLHQEKQARIAKS